MSRPTAFLILLLCLLSRSQAQKATVFTEPMSAPDEPQGLIKLDVAATDASGKLVTGLTQQEFTLLDNGQPQKILSFHASETSDPAQVILLVDVLDASPQLVAQIRGAVLEFLRRDEGRLGHTTAIFQLSAEGLGRIGVPSVDGNALAAEMEKHHQVILKSTLNQDGNFRGVPLQDRDKAPIGSVVPTEIAGLKAFGEIAVEERRKPGRKLVLWVGPGFGVGTGAYRWASDRRMTPDEHRRLLYIVDWMSTLLRDARIVLDVFSFGETEPLDSPLNRYTTFLDGPKSAKDATWVHLYKKVVAIQSGGQTFEPSGDVVTQMVSCVSGARSYYAISFDPSNATQPDEYHKLVLQIGKPGVTAQTRTSYFDQPYYTDQTDAETKPVTVQQLEQMLRDSHVKRDGDEAQDLSELRLTERLDGAKLHTLASGLRGEKARQQLVMLADTSAFRDPPPSEVPDNPAPDAATQRQMIQRALDDLNATIPKLPNVIATRTTVRYQEPSQFVAAENTETKLPLRKMDSSSEMVAYRRGSEVREGGTTATRKSKPEEGSLVLSGTFGPALTAAVDILSSPERLTWKRWGDGTTGRRAVFSFTFPAADLSVGTTGCCLPDGEGTTYFPHLESYSGEIEIDPANGALLRLETRANPKSTVPILRTDTMIEYGPVNIGGKPYICPLRSVALTRERSIRVFISWDEGFRTYGPFVTLLNDISFSGYHVFRAQSRILTSVTPPAP